MRLVIRYFFRALRVILGPFVLLKEKLTTPAAIERSAAEQARVDRECQRLALYQFRTCPFCIRVRKEMARLALPIEKRDAQHDEQHRTALAEGGGRVKVPCLRIEQEQGGPQWLYESEDIKAWLQAHFEPTSASA